MLSLMRMVLHGARSGVSDDGPSRELRQTPANKVKLDKSGVVVAA
jgi:hypothetical protein